jgi:hypothetical protein
MLVLINLPAALRQAPAANGSGNGTPTLFDHSVERIVAEVGVDRIWRALDRLDGTRIAAGGGGVTRRPGRRSHRAAPFIKRQTHHANKLRRSKHRVRREVGF